MHRPQYQYQYTGNTNSILVTRKDMVQGIVVRYRSISTGGNGTTRACGTVYDVRACRHDRLCCPAPSTAASSAAYFVAPVFFSSSSCAPVATTATRKDGIKIKNGRAPALMFILRCCLLYCCLPSLSLSSREKTACICLRSILQNVRVWRYASLYCYFRSLLRLARFFLLLRLCHQHYRYGVTTSSVRVIGLGRYRN